MTLEALIMAYTSLPFSSPRFSADSSLITEIISAPPASWTTTSEFTAPGIIYLILPLRILRTLIFIEDLL